MAGKSVAVEEKPKVDREALADEAAAQLAAYRVEMREYMQLFGSGAARWEERGWGWKTPDWDDDPTAWPPVARMLYFYERINAAQSRANMARHFVGRPHYCSDCGEQPTSLHSRWPCADHTDWVGMVKVRAADLFPEAHQ